MWKTSDRKMDVTTAKKNSYNQTFETGLIFTYEIIRNSLYEKWVGE